ncbi:hypothetical protein SCAR479_06769 [Seiridium cardinale]|uniref:Uncharacterized protein n=1 Tax=Seiridium cardinale TaxID=138064 RepID=A0ABR2XRL0_9PEZI
MSQLAERPLKGDRYDNDKDDTKQSTLNLGR